jgi:hypothetical protein
MYICMYVYIYIYIYTYIHTYIHMHTHTITNPPYNSLPRGTHIIVNGIDIPVSGELLPTDTTSPVPYIPFFVDYSG